MNKNIKASRKILIRYITSYYIGDAKAEGMNPYELNGSHPSFWNKCSRRELEEECHQIHEIVSFGDLC